MRNRADLGLFVAEVCGGFALPPDRCSEISYSPSTAREAYGVRLVPFPDEELTVEAWSDVGETGLRLRRVIEGGGRRFEVAAIREGHPPFLAVSKGIEAFSRRTGQQIYGFSLRSEWNPGACIHERPGSLRLKRHEGHHGLRVWINHPTYTASVETLDGSPVSQATGLYQPQIEITDDEVSQIFRTLGGGQRRLVLHRLSHPGPWPVKLEIPDLPTGVAVAVANLRAEIPGDSHQILNWGRRLFENGGVPIPLRGGIPVGMALLVSTALFSLAYHLLPEGDSCYLSS